MAIQFNRMLPKPAETKEKYPITLKAVEAKEKNDIEIRKVLTGESDKLLLIIGPQIVFVIFLFSVVAA